MRGVDLWGRWFLTLEPKVSVSSKIRGLKIKESRDSFFSSHLCLFRGFNECTLWVVRIQSVSKFKPSLFHLTQTGSQGWLNFWSSLSPRKRAVCHTLQSSHSLGSLCLSNLSLSMTIASQNALLLTFPITIHNQPRFSSHSHPTEFYTRLLSYIWYLVAVVGIHGWGQSR